MKSLTGEIGWRTPVAAAAVLATVLALVGSASASPLYFTGPNFGAFNFGTVAAEVTAAQSADAGLDVLNIDSPVDGVTFSLSLAGTVSLSNPTCASMPSDPACLNLSVVIPPSLPVTESSNPSKADPTLATSIWDVTNTSGSALDKAYLVFAATVGALNMDPALVGLDPVSADGYTVINFNAVGFGAIYYAAIELGPMALGETTQVSVHYVVADDLIPAGGPNFLLPALNTQAIVVPSVPEPGVVWLVATGLAALSIARRRKYL